MVSRQRAAKAARVPGHWEWAGNGRGRGGFGFPNPPRPFVGPRVPSDGKAAVATDPPTPSDLRIFFQQCGAHFSD